MRNRRSLALATLATLLVCAAPVHARGLTLGVMDGFSNASWFDKAQSTGVQIVRLSPSWGAIAPTRPANPTDPNDPAYRWGDLDAEVIAATARGLEPLITTECWSLVDYKDAPMLPWDYLIELCELGTRRAAASGRWAAIATSNFCGPQFQGMWRDVAWHRRMTDVIHQAKLPAF